MSALNQSAKIMGWSLALALAVFVTGDAAAATLQLLPSARTLAVGEEFKVDLLLDTANISINTTEATVSFPNDIVEIVSASREGSIFSFWLEEPTISSEKDSLKFIGGTPRGVAGDALQILRLTFKAKSVGVADLALSNAVVTAADGKGSNVLSKIVGTNVTVSSAVAAPEPLLAPVVKTITPPEVKLEAPPPTERPQPVVRPPAPAGELPPPPPLRVPLYPDESRWYNQIGEAIVLWDLAPDISQVAAKLARSPDTSRGETEAKLFTGKSFGVIGEGIWFVTVHARNNIGWSEAARRRIALDRTPPLPFNIEIDVAVSDDPARTIKFETQDSLSGVARAQIAVDDHDPIILPIATTTDLMVTLPPQPPGAHTVLARVFDAAGNSVEADLPFEVLPLPAPSISFFMPAVSQEELIFVSGKAIPGGLLTVRVRDAHDRQVAAGEVVSDAAGDWSVSIDQPLARGQYVLSAQVIDERGAMSLVSADRPFTVKPKTIIAIGWADLGWFEIMAMLALALTALASLAAAHLMRRRRKRAAYTIIAGRDVNKLCALLVTECRDLRHYQELTTTENSRAKIEAGEHLQRLEELIAKMKKYLGREVDKLKE